MVYINLDLMIVIGNGIITVAESAPACQ